MRPMTIISVVAKLDELLDALESCLHEAMATHLLKGDVERLDRLAEEARRRWKVGETVRKAGERKKPALRHNRVYAD